MFPDNQSTRVIFVSQAEEQFYENCRRNLAGDWRVYHSCTLSTLEPGEGLRDNEIDFVLYHPRFGLVICEVKGGRIEFDSDKGLFYSINRNDKKFAIKNPFQQVLSWKSRFLRYLKKENIRVPVSHCVCFPKVDEGEIPTTVEVEPSLIIGRNRIATLEKSLKDLVKTHQPERFLNFEDVGKDVDRILKGASFSSRLYLRDYIDAHEMRVKDIEFIHETLITPITSAQRLGVEGEAGTGKTMLAMMLAKHFRGQGRSVLFLSSNPFLNVYLQTELGEGVDVRTYTELSSSYGVEILRRPSTFKGSREDWIQYEGPELLKAAIAKGSKRYDVVLCDEAQDVQPFWWESLETIVNPENGRFYVFFDRSQGVFGSLSSENTFVPEDVLPLQPPYFPLVHNYRNTREIAGFSRAFRTGKEILQSHSARLGYLPEVIVYNDADDAKAKLTQLMRRLFKEEQVAPKDVAILSARRPFLEGSVLKDLQKADEHKLVDMHSSAGAKVLEGDMEAVKVSTITSFKGLETPIGIICNICEYNLPLTNAIMSSLVYVAASRAKHMLYIFVKKDDPKVKAVQEAVSKVVYTGSMLVEGSSADYEFNGTVIHYNPDRVGWLKVEDPAFEKSNIMFFPYDVSKANLATLKIGEKLTFKPRVEGHITIACDLKPAPV